LQTLQNKATRLVANKPWNTSTNPLYHKTNILKQDIVKLQIGKIMQDLHHGKFQYQFYNIPSVQTVHSYETRSKSNMNYYQNQARTEIGIGATLLKKLGGTEFNNIKFFIFLFTTSSCTARVPCARIQ